MGFMAYVFVFAGVV